MLRVCVLFAIAVAVASLPSADQHRASLSPKRLQPKRLRASQYVQYRYKSAVDMVDGVNVSAALESLDLSFDSTGIVPAFGLTPIEKKYVELELMGPLGNTGINMRLRTQLQWGEEGGAYKCAFNIAGSFMFGGFIGFEVALGVEAAITVGSAAGDSLGQSISKLIVSSVISALKDGTSGETKDASKQAKVWQPQKDLWDEVHAARVKKQDPPISFISEVEVSTANTAASAKGVTWTVKFKDSAAIAVNETVSMKITGLSNCKSAAVEQYRLLINKNIGNYYGYAADKISLTLSTAIPKDTQVIVNIVCDNPENPVTIRPAVQTSKSIEDSPNDWFEAALGVSIVNTAVGFEEVYVHSSARGAKAKAVEWFVSFKTTKALAANAIVTIKTNDLVCSNADEVNDGPDKLIPQPQTTPGADVTFKANGTIPVGTVLTVLLTCNNPQTAMTVVPTVQSDSAPVPVAPARGVDIGQAETSFALHRSNSIVVGNTYMLDYQVIQDIRGPQGLCKDPSNTGNKNPPNMMTTFRTGVCNLLTGSDKKAARNIKLADDTKRRTWVGQVAIEFARAFMVPSVSADLTSKFNFTTDAKTELECTRQEKGTKLQYAICHMFKYGLFGNIFDANNEKDNIISGMEFQYPFLFSSGDREDKLLDTFCSPTTACTDNVGDRWTAMVHAPPNPQKGAILPAGTKMGETQLQVYVRSLSSAKEASGLSLAGLKFSGSVEFKVGFESADFVLTAGAMVSVEKEIQISTSFLGSKRILFAPATFGIGIKVTLESPVFNFAGLLNFKKQGGESSKELSLEISFPVSQGIHDWFYNLFGNIATWYPYFEILVKAIANRDATESGKEVFFEIMGTLYDVLKAVITADTGGAGSAVASLAWSSGTPDFAEDQFKDSIVKFAKIFSPSASSISGLPIETSYAMSLTFKYDLGKKFELAMGVIQKVEVGASTGAFKFKGGAGQWKGLTATLDFTSPPATPTVTESTPKGSGKLSITFTGGGTVSCVARNNNIQEAPPPSSAVLGAVSTPSAGRFAGTGQVIIAKTGSAPGVITLAKSPGGGALPKGTYKIFCAAAGLSGVYPDPTSTPLVISIP